MLCKSRSIIFFTLMISILFSSCSNQSGNGKDYKSKEKEISFNAPSLTNDKEFTFKDFEGKPTILNFWASWCVPCRDEMPFLEETWNELKGRNINIVGINVMDDKKEALSVLKQFNITYINLFDQSGDISRKFGVLGLPATIFINKSGKVVKQNYGPFLGEQGEKQFHNFVGEIL